MRILKLVLIWLTASALVLTIYAFGQVKYYWYENDEGRGYLLPRWHGTSLDDVCRYSEAPRPESPLFRISPGTSLDDCSRYPKGYTYRYETYRFESNAEVRTILIIMILAGAGVLSIRILSASKSDANRKEATT